MSSVSRGPVGGKSCVTLDSATLSEPHLTGTQSWYSLILQTGSLRLGVVKGLP